MNDEKIKLSIAAKDENAIRQVMEKHSRLLWKVSWGVLDRIGCIQDVEECVADTLNILLPQGAYFDEQIWKRIQNITAFYRDPETLRSRIYYLIPEA